MKKLIHFITYSKAAAYIAALLCVASWCVQVEEKTLLGALWLLLTLLAGYLLVKVNREFSLSDSKSTLPATLYLMGSSIVPDLFAQHGAGMHVALFSFSCYVLLRTYRERCAMGSYFLAFTLIGIQCLLAPPLLLVLPWLLLCGAFMESLHVRTFFAALWGLLSPYWVVCGMLFLTDRIGIVAPYLRQISSMMSNSLPPLSEFSWWGQFLWTLLIVVPGSIGILLNRAMKLQTSAIFRLLIGAVGVFFVAMWFSTAYAALLSCVLLIAPLIGSAMFAMGGNRVKDIYLIVLLLVWLFLLVLSCGTACGFFN